MKISHFNYSESLIMLGAISPRLVLFSGSLGEMKVSINSGVESISWFNWRWIYG